MYTTEWKNPYQYEPTFRESCPIIEWIDDTVLRMGGDRSDQPFYDRLIIYNNTDKRLKHIGVTYGRFESFRIFDLAPGKEITLEGSPGFKPDGTSNFWIGYGGASQDGREFHGNIEKKQRTSPSDGPLTFQITINEKDLK